MIVDADVGVRTVGQFNDLFLGQLRPDDLIVANDTRVLPARIRVSRPGGGAAELLLLNPLDQAGRWRAMARPGKRLRPGMKLQPIVGGDALITCIGRTDDDGGDWIVELPAGVGTDWLETVGELPLPPYMDDAEESRDAAKAGRYQTVYANEQGSVAAPTAGLHLDAHAWQSLRDTYDVHTVTLHVGPGTFLPVRADNLNDHTMHAERYSIPAATAEAITQARRDGRRIVAIGTTTTRVLESAWGNDATDVPLSGSTDLFIRPGYGFSVVGALLTNFHLPGSTLLALVMALAGIDTMHAAYREAIERQMRFFSFGDAMFIHGPEH